MSVTKHTPGPWHPFDDPKSNYGLQVNSDSVIKAKKVVCRVGGPDRVANARLIAAAPLLLAEAVAARQVIQNMIDAHGDHGAGVMVKALDAAIRKATGET